MRSLRLLARYRHAVAARRRAEGTARRLASELVEHDELGSNERRTLFATIEALRAENGELRDGLAVARAKADAGYPSIHGVVPPDTSTTSALRHQLALARQTLATYEDRLAAYEGRPTGPYEHELTTASGRRWTPDAHWTTENEETTWNP